MIKRRQANHARNFLDSGRIRKRRKRRKLFKRIGLTILAIGLIIGFIYLFRIPQFQLKDISISGVNHIDTVEMERQIREYIAGDTVLLGLIQPTSSIFISDHAIASSLQNNFLRIKSLDVHTSLLGHMKVIVKEREVAGIWCRTIQATTKANEVMKNEIPETSIATSSASTTEDTVVTSVIPESLKDECYSVDEDGLVFDMVKEDIQDLLVFRGLLADKIIGENFLDKKSLVDLKKISLFLHEKNLKNSYIECEEKNICRIYIAKTTQNNQISQSDSKSWIIIDLENEIQSVIDRLGVALEGKPLQGSPFQYIDTRFGNKLFYKLNGAASSTSEEI